MKRPFDLSVTMKTCVYLITMTVPVCVHAQVCSNAEMAGIAQCQSAGSGFLYDQKKSQTCPQSTDTNTSTWSCDMWKCHQYCSNPERDDERKSCDNCDAVVVTELCWETQVTLCETGKPKGSDLKCSTANLCTASGTMAVLLALLLQIIL